MNQLTVQALNKSFDDSVKVLNSVDFAIGKGDFLVVLGPSGCGKTTLLRIISGLEAADSGQIYIAGKDVTKIEPKYRDVAMVFQNYALYPHMTVFENLAFALKIRKLPKAALSDKVNQTADILGLTKYLYRKPKQLSGGQRQRVALGRAIVRNPALFLFDEPLSNLDAELRSQMRLELLSLHRKIGATSLFVTHDQVEAMSLADKIIILNNGRQIGPERPRELYDDPPDTFVAGFLGSPGMNLLKAVTSDEGTSANIGEGIFILADRKLPPNRPVIIGFRPEACRPDQQGVIPALVTGYEDSGKEYIIELAGPDGQRIFCLSKIRYNIGESLRLLAEKFHYFDGDTGTAIRSI